MSTNSKIISMAQMKWSPDSLELHSLGHDANASPAGDGVILRAQFLMECTDPKCVSGTQPSKQPINGFSDEPVQITLGPGDQPNLRIENNGTNGQIPILDRSLGVPCSDDCGKPDARGMKTRCGALCAALAPHRQADPRIAEFYIYRVTSASGALSALQDALIAIPVAGDPGTAPAAGSPSGS